MTEEALHVAVVDFLRRALPPDAVLHHSPNEGMHKPQYRARQLRKGMRPGWPDLVVLHAGSLLCIELKTAKGRLSIVQQRCHDDIEKAGGFVAVARSLEDVEAFLTTCGIPLRARMMA